MFKKKLKIGLLAVTVILLSIQLQAQKPTVAPAKPVKMAVPVKAAQATSNKVQEKKQEAVKTEKKVGKKAELTGVKAEKKVSDEKKSADKKITVGPRGGKYYMDKNGKKTYVK